MKTAKVRTEKRPISDLAKKTATMVANQLQTQFQNGMNEVAADILKAMGLSPADGWVVDFGQGAAIRPIAPARKGPPVSHESVVLRKKKR